jgi:transmembrane sensor
MGDPENEPLPQAITDEAARWVSESFDGQLSPDQQAKLEAWLADDPRHGRAFAEMRDVWAHMGGVSETPALRASVAAALRRRPHGRRPRNRTRHRSRWVAPAIAASLALLFVGVMDDWPTRLRADAMTATGERRTMTLPDGSSVHLDTQSAIAIDFGGDRRVVRLLKGEVAFSVTPDPARPFTVEAGGGSATALGTRFLVRREGDDTRVIVTEHRVRVAYPVPEGRSALLDEGDGIGYGPDLGLGRIATVNAADAMAWTDGVLVFKDAPLSEVVAAIGRYHSGYIRVTGGAQERRVSGVFRIDDPVAALDQLQRSLGLRSARLTDRLIFIYA